MEHYIEIATKQGLAGEAALAFAVKQMEREERREERERQKEREDAEMQEKRAVREEKERQAERDFELEKLRVTMQAEAGQGDHGRAPRKLPKMPMFEEGTDMDAYLTRFERVAESNEWSKEEWAVSLSTLLTGTALEVRYIID